MVNLGVCIDEDMEYKSEKLWYPAYMVMPFLGSTAS